MNLKKKIDVLFAKISIVEREVSTLKKENNKLSQGLKKVTSENVKLRKENTQLKEKVVTLEGKLYKKNSSKSSIPPSKDENGVKPNQSLREKTGKKSGGQIGHPGSTLKMHTTVDKVVNHKANYCSLCSAQLVGEQDQEGRRQVVDIPPIQPKITEHQIYSTVCTCGEKNSTCYPKEATAPIS